MIGRHYHARACSFAHCGGGENYISLFSEPLMMKGGREEVARARLPNSSYPPSDRVDAAGDPM